MSYVEANKCSGSRSSDLKMSFFFVCYDFCLHRLGVLADSADARFMCLIYTPDRCTAH